MAYFTLTLFFAAIWLGVFIARSDLRRPLLLVSFVIAPLGPVSELWFLRDYWLRETLSGAYIGVDDALFSFFVGGVTFSIYKTVTGATLSRTKQSRRFSYIPLGAILITSFFMLVLTNLLGINSIFSSALAFIATSAIIWYKRSDLFFPSIASGFLSLALFVAGYILIERLFPGILRSWCLHCNPTGLRLLGINVEELIWDFTWGLVGGTIFEATTGKDIQQRGDPDKAPNAIECAIR
jgi:hypothetical protein